MKVLFLLGAGASYNSGIPTFEGIGSTKINKDYLDIEYIAKNMGRSLLFLQSFKQTCINKKQNNYHKYIKELSQKHTINIISQNIDDLDNDLPNVIKLHGEVNKNRCSSNRKHKIKDKILGDKCPQCKSCIIPNILYYNEAYPQQITEKIKELLKIKYDYFIIIGTTLNIPYVHNIALKVKSDIKVNINPDKIKLNLKNLYNYKNLEDYKKDIGLLL